MKSRRLFTLLALTTLPLTAAKATTYFDPFTDGTLVGGADNSGLAWYRRSSNQGLAIASDAAGIGSGNALNLTISGSQIDRAVIGVFSDFTLVNVGDQIGLAFAFRLTVTPTLNKADGVRFGLYNANGTPLTASATGESDDDFGYQASIGIGTTPGFNLFEEQNSGVGGLGSDNPTADRISLSPTVLTTKAIGDTVAHSLLYTITKTASGVSFSTTVDGISLGTGVDTVSPYLTFNEVVVTHGSPQAFFMDNVTVTTTTVPEPSGAALLGLGLVGLMTSRRVARRSGKAIMGLDPRG